MSQASAARTTEPRSSLPGFGQAKACILLFMYGSPSQLETFDPKPDAPLEIRGELGCIPSSVPGLNVCERLPRLARVMDKVTADPLGLASLPDPRGRVRDDRHPADRVPMELNPRDPRHWPFIGSVVDTSTASARRTRRPTVVDAAQPRACPGRSAASGSARWPAPGLTAGSSARRTTRSAPSSSARGPRRRARRSTRRSGKTSSPIAASRPRAGSSLGAVVESRPRADARPARPPPHAAGAARSSSAARPTRRPTATGIDRHRAMAYDLLGSERLRQAFDLGQEAVRNPRPLRHDPVRPGGPDGTSAGRGGRPVRHRLLGRVRPGRHRLGHPLGPLPPDEGRAPARPGPHALGPVDRPRPPRAARRDAGRALERARPHAQAGLGPGRAAATTGRGATRSSWPAAASPAAGSSAAPTRSPATPVERRVSPKDILATIYHLLGIDPATMLTDRQGRPMPLIPEGEVIAEVLG